MKWKNKIWVIDDIIPTEAQEAIKQKLLGEQFPWVFIPDISSRDTEHPRPGFAHNFVKDGKINPDDEVHSMNMLQFLWTSGLNVLKEKTNSVFNYSVVKSRAFLQVPLRNVTGGEYDSHHIDVPMRHIVFLYYVCDADGDTVIFENMYSKKNKKTPKLAELKEKVRVTPKQGRMVIFDGHYWHTATQPSENARCVLNTDIEVLPT